MPTNARRGLDLLLEATPDADVITVTSHREADGTWSLANPWTIVTMSFTPGSRVRYAVWNATGAVHRMRGGEVLDPPFLELGHALSEDEFDRLPSG